MGSQARTIKHAALLAGTQFMHLGNLFFLVQTFHREARRYYFSRPTLSFMVRTMQVDSTLASIVYIYLKYLARTTQNTLRNNNISLRALTKLSTFPCTT